jgi:membrane protein YqaA with SNARE-associated domain
MFSNLKNKILAFLSGDQSSEKRVDFTLGGISFAESSFFPIPPDFFIFPLVVKKPERWLRISIIVTIFSVLGGVVGYFIGFYFYEFAGKPLVSFYGLQDEMNTVGGLFNKNAFLAIFTAAFTPIPYKVFTIAGGFFEINF